MPVKNRAAAEAEDWMLSAYGYIDRDVLEKVKTRIQGQYFAGLDIFGGEESLSITDRKATQDVRGEDALAAMRNDLPELFIDGFDQVYTPKFNAAFDALKLSISNQKTSTPTISTWEKDTLDSAVADMEAGRTDYYRSWSLNSGIGTRSDPIDAAKFLNDQRYLILGNSLRRVGIMGANEVETTAQFAYNYLGNLERKAHDTKQVKDELAAVIKPLEDHLKELQVGSPQWLAASDQLTHAKGRAEYVTATFERTGGGFDQSLTNPAIDAHTWALTQGADIVQTVGAVQQRTAAANRAKAGLEFATGGMAAVSGAEKRAPGAGKKLAGIDWKKLLEEAGGNVNVANDLLKIQIDQAEIDAKGETDAATATAKTGQYAQDANMSLEELRVKNPAVHARLVARYGQDVAARHFELAGADPVKAGNNLEHAIKMAESEDANSKSYAAAFSDANDFDQTKLSPRLQGVIESGMPLTEGDVSEFTRAHKFYGAFENSLSPDGGTVEERAGRTKEVFAGMWKESGGDVEKYQKLQQQRFSQTPEVEQAWRSTLPGWKTPMEQMGYIKTPTGWQEPSAMPTGMGASIAALYAVTPEQKEAARAAIQQEQEQALVANRARTAVRGRKM